MAPSQPIIPLYKNSYRHIVKKKKKFYRHGLTFECTSCGNCCTKSDGFVNLDESEAANIAKLLNLSESEFLETYVDMLPEAKTLSLKSRSNGDCIFLKDEQCQVYQARPTQCRTFPFWPENLKSAYRWRHVEKECPGIGTGRLYPAKEIEEILKDQRK